MFSPVAEPLVTASYMEQIRALVNSELEACLALHESKEFWQQRLDRPGANVLNWIEMGGSDVPCSMSRVLLCCLISIATARDDRCFSSVMSWSAPYMQGKPPVVVTAGHADSGRS